MLLGPSIELVENPGELAAPAAEPVAPAVVPLQDPGREQILEPGGEHRGADPSPLAELGEREGVPPELPDQPKGPAPAEQVQRALNWSSRRHYYGFRTLRTPISGNP